MSSPPITETELAEMRALAPKLALLADWFDLQHGEGRWEAGSVEVQNDLRMLSLRLPRCLDEIDALRGKLRQAVGLLEDAANWEDIGPLEIETQKEIAEFCKGLRLTLSPAGPEGESR